LKGKIPGQPAFADEPGASQDEGIVGEPLVSEEVARVELHKAAQPDRVGPVRAAQGKTPVVHGDLRRDGGRHRRPRFANFLPAFDREQLLFEGADLLPQFPDFIGLGPAGRARQRRKHQQQGQGRDAAPAKRPAQAGRNGAADRTTLGEPSRKAAEQGPVVFHDQRG